MKLAIASLALIAASAFAQEPAASAASAAAITPGTACGAAGTGYAMRYTADSPSRRVPVQETRPASEAGPDAWASLVDGKGVWQACKMPPKPKDCPPKPAPAKWADDDSGRQCVPSPGAMLPGRNVSPVDITVYSAGYFSANPAPGQRVGSLTYECRKEGWVLIKRYCR